MSWKVTTPENMWTMINKKLTDDDEMLDDTPIGFGKHSDKTPNEVADEDPSYLLWAYNNGKGICSRKLALACEMMIDDE